ncbi:DNA helicase [Dyadobacter endophyticus]|uniref:DNA 3'-5' helicase n=1 Tax=Dyadobacter endophyticus TaxID=1749036 RepID=A0ABQ1YGJ8_9BACT|nr:ATP-dependent helicase [Dyadobacter endophyticus]GGH24952.1 DNA helicase [Dyadobacter endophyticus]
MFQDLNKQQKTAVLTAGHVLLSACPGSGKTRVLATKVGLELDKISNTKKMVVALTFTNRAAEEIKRRLAKIDIDAEKLWAGTIHSFCLEWIIRPYSPYLEEVKNGFVIADEYKCEDLIASLKDQYGFEWWESISTRRNLDGAFSERDPRFRDLLSNYDQMLAGQRLIDFDLILYFSYKLLHQYPKICKSLSNLIHLLAVDEYQDTQELQYAILAKIVSARESTTSLFMVGDEDQAIYGSLGGVAKSLPDISVQFGKISITPLELSGNYRSTQRIIDYYRNYQSRAISIESLAAHAEEAGLLTFNNEIHKDDLPVYIAEIIQHNIAMGVPEHEICVLAPQWPLVIPMGKMLKSRLPDVNFDAVGLSPLMKNKENIWFKVARLFLVPPSPRMYFVRARWTFELIDEFVALGIEILPGVEKKAKVFLRHLNSVTCDEDDGLAHLEHCFGELMERLGIEIAQNSTLKQHWEYFFESTKKRMDDARFDYARDIGSFKKLFSHATGVVVNTCHGVKGEEFHTVIAFGLLHGYVPNWKDDDHLATSKKLLYVICSRAKNHLHLISERGRKTRKGSPYTTTMHLQNVRYPYD